MINKPGISDSPLAGRTVPPQGYVAQDPGTGAMVPRTYPIIPTPPNQGYQPASSLRSPMPGILADPDQQRQIYTKGVNLRRFWPIWL